LRGLPEKIQQPGNRQNKMGPNLLQNLPLQNEKRPLFAFKTPAQALNTTSSEDPRPPD